MDKSQENETVTFTDEMIVKALRRMARRERIICEEFQGSMCFYLQDLLDDEDRRELEDHLEGCERCRMHLEYVRNLQAEFAGQHTPTHEAPDILEHIHTRWEDWCTTLTDVLGLTLQPVPGFTLQPAQGFRRGMDRDRKPGPDQQEQEANDKPLKFKLPVPPEHRFITQLLARQDLEDAVVIRSNDPANTNAYEIEPELQTEDKGPAQLFVITGPEPLDIAKEEEAEIDLDRLQEILQQARSRGDRILCYEYEVR